MAYFERNNSVGRQVHSVARLVGWCKDLVDVMFRLASYPGPKRAWERGYMARMRVQEVVLPHKRSHCHVILWSQNSMSVCICLSAFGLPACLSASTLIHVPLPLVTYSLSHPPLPPSQGRCAGIIIGCLIGMFPLLWIRPREPQSPLHSVTTEEHKS